MEQQFLILQVHREWYMDRLVWALILQNVCNQEHNSRYKRVGLVGLEHYNFGKFIPTKPNMFAPERNLLHPLERGDKAGFETKEWQVDKWKKRRILLLYMVMPDSICTLQALKVIWIPFHAVQTILRRSSVSDIVS
jgi:hypothetical protein